MTMNLEDTANTMITKDIADIVDIADSVDSVDSADINMHIDMCIFNSTHYDIACVVHKCLKGRHRYANTNIWEYLKSSEDGKSSKSGEWVIDKNAEELTYAIKTKVCNAFTKRSLYWGDIKECDKYPDTEVISMKLLQISSKLKDNKYISILIKESRLFFYESYGGFGSSSDTGNL
jgi:hypothetical protein